MKKKTNSVKSGIKTKRRGRSGRGILNSTINKLPFEMHLPGYQFCGPGTKLKERLKAGQKGINELDQACRTHDIAYENSANLENRRVADKLLSEKAWKQVKSKNARFGEKLAALTVAGLMKTKSAIGAGMHTRKKIKKTTKEKKKKKKKEKNSSAKIGRLLHTAVKSAKIALKERNPKTMSDAVRVAIQAAKCSMENNSLASSSSSSSPKYNNNIQRIIPVPKIGGVLPLIPIFAGLSAIGALAGGSAAVANAVITANNAKQHLKESERHNQIMEAIALGRNRRGDGVFLKPYRNGLGLYTRKRTLTKNC